MASNTDRRRVPTDYRIACICPMGVELAPVEAMLDEIHDPLPTSRDQNAYTLGHIGAHNVVIVIMPETGNNTAAVVAIQLLNDFPAIRFGLLVGIGGGVPGAVDIRLGDVVVSQATDTFGGVVQYDLGKRVGDGTFNRTGLLNKPPSVLSANVRKLQSQHRRQRHQLLELMSDMVERYPNMRLEFGQPTTEDRLFKETYVHSSEGDCEGCDVEQIVNRPLRSVQQPVIHYGTIGSANTVLKDAVRREQLRKDMNLLCVEMEAAGLMNDFPCLVIRGICDYADSHKNKEWQPYAAAVAAAYMKELVQIIPVDQVLQSHSTTEAARQGTPQSTTLYLDQSQKLKTGGGPQFVSKQMSSTQNFTSVSGTVSDYTFRNPVGPCLGQAPCLQRDYFIGRDHELKEMAEVLLANGAFNDQRRLVLGGMGGIGKTQLALAYAQQYTQHYDSMFWFNATSEATLMASFQAVAKRIFAPQDYHAIDAKHLSDYVHGWLSHRSNTRWLMIFDNYDEPQTYDIRSFYPNTAHGTIIVTTRRADLVAGEQVPVKPFSTASDGLRILQTRSGRGGMDKDIGANRLVKRLAGLPLALATAGVFLRKSVWTFQQYLDVYEERWTISTRKPPVLTEYQDRTLCTTWELSYDCLKEEEPDAAKLLQLFAYFDHQAIWYDLLHAGITDDLPDWLSHIVNDSGEFESIMRILVDYCFIETQSTTLTYSIHTCVHDWTVAGLNQTPEPWSYWYAFHCVASSIKDDDWELFGHVRYARFTPHAVRLMTKFTDIRHNIAEADLEAAEDITMLLRDQVQLSSAASLLARVLTVKKEALGVEHASTLRTMQNLGGLYRDQGKLAAAEQMYKRVLAGYEKARGAEHISILGIVNNLGLLYGDQGMLAAAEQMYKRVLAGYEKERGMEHMSTLKTVNNLGNLYRAQGKLAAAEQMYERALAGQVKARGEAHMSTLNTVNNLGNLYRDQGKLAAAEQMYKRALAGYEKTLVAEHITTLTAVSNLGVLYYDQGKLAAAEQMYERTLAGHEKARGAEHTLTLITVYNLGNLYRDQGKLAAAEQMYERALAGQEKALGAEHTSTLNTVHNLGTLYWRQGKLATAEQYLKRAIIGMQHSLGADHPTTRKAFGNLERLSLAITSKQEDNTASSSK